MLLFSNPSLDGPNFEFRDGQTHGGQIQIPSAFTSVAGTRSSWHLQQWGKNLPLHSPDVAFQAADTDDPLYGNALYSWKTDDLKSEFRVYQGATSYVYDLISRDGSSYNGSGSNLFLETSAGSAKYTFVHPITYSLSARITEASTKYDPRFGSAYSSGVVAQIFTGFTVHFNDSHNPNYRSNLPTFNTFMQIGISDSRGDVGGRGEYRGVVDGTFINGWTAPNDPRLAFAASEQAPRTLTYSLNQHVQHMIDNDPYLTMAERDLHLWSLSSVYVGLETQNTDNTVGSPFQGQAQGNVVAGLEISDVQVNYDPLHLYTGSVQQAVTLQDRMVAYQNGSTQMSGVLEAATYVGPVNYLSSEHIYAGQDDMTFSSSTSNIYIHSGSGNDAIQVQSGHNVLDGGTGSNFLTGGSGVDTFFLDARATDVTWDTIVKFHATDAVTVWGFVPGSGEYWWDGISGADGHQGATLQMDLHGEGVSSNITFAGMSTAQAKNLIITTGQVDAGPYLWIYNPGT